MVVQPREVIDAVMEHIGEIRIRIMRPRRIVVAVVAMA